jgi:hypothetical protein
MATSTTDLRAPEPEATEPRATEPEVGSLIGPPETWPTSPSIHLTEKELQEVRERLEAAIRAGRMSGSVGKLPKVQCKVVNRGKPVSEIVSENRD